MLYYKSLDKGFMLILFLMMKIVSKVTYILNKTNFLPLPTENQTIKRKIGQKGTRTKKPKKKYSIAFSRKY